jgi:hypothetical protein
VKVYPLCMSMSRLSRKMYHIHLMEKNI